jgi:hypothetical protein
MPAHSRYLRRLAGLHPAAAFGLERYGLGGRRSYLAPLSPAARALYDHLRTSKRPGERMFRGANCRWLRGLALDVISRSWPRTNSNEPYLRSRRIGSPAGRPRTTEIDFAPERRRHDGYRFGEDRSASRVHPMNGLHDWYRLERTLGVV